MAGNQPDLEAIFFAARQKAPQDRAVYLDEACANHPELRQRVEQFLRAQAELGSFLEAPSPALVATLDEQISERPGSVIGPYKLMEEIGAGGFGLVFVAEQQHPVRRKVALKVVKPGMDTREVIARFEAERQALALMDHPNIARVLDGGETASGRPYFVMELVKGTPITEYCDREQLPVRARLELFLQVCLAVQHAHQKGIIHRDLKPSNVLVASHDGKPAVRVIDFGVAKAIGQQLTDKTVYTQLAQLLGTPLYMSPEQAGLSSLDIDTRSDIYSLGVLLYELLTGTTPFDKERFKQAGYDEIRRIIREEEPPRPSTRISMLAQAATTISTQRKTDPKRLSQLLRGELDWIVMKCLEKERNRRYETANALAQDVQRFLADEPVQACPPSALYRIRKFSRRHKSGLAFAGLALCVFVLFGSGVGWIAGEWTARRTETDRAVTEALDESGKWQQEGRIPEALAAARRADWLANNGGASQALSQRVQARRADLELVADLEEASLQKTAVKNEQFDGQLKDRLYAEAFRNARLDFDALSEEEAAARIRASSVAVELAAALDEWAWTREATPGRANLSNTHLRRVARAADPDGLRDRLRDSLERKDPQALLHLAQSEEVLQLPRLDVLLLGNVLQSTGQFEHAEVLLRKARQQHPEDFWTNHALAWILERAQPPRWDEAICYYTAAIAIRPQSPGAHVNLGGALYKKGRLEQAVTEWREAVRLNKDYAAPHNNLGAALSQNGRSDEAVAEFREAIRINKDYAGAHHGLALELEKQGFWDEAISECRKALGIKRDASTHNDLGAILCNRMCNYDTAIAEFNSAIGIKEDYPEAHFNLAIALEKKERRDEAIGEYKRAVQLKPDYADAHHNLGLALAAKGLSDDAIREFRKAAEINKDNPKFQYNLGTALYQKGSLDEAIAVHTLAIELAKDMKDRPLYLVGLGSALARKGLRDDAIFNFNQAIALNKEFALAHYNLGSILVEKGLLDEAMREFQDTLRLDKKNAPAQSGMAFVFNEKALRLRRSGNRDAARAAYEEALAINKQLVADFPRVPIYREDLVRNHEGLANLLRESGDRPAARAVLEACLSVRKRLAADFPDVQKHSFNLVAGYWRYGAWLREEGEPHAALGQYTNAIDTLRPIVVRDAGQFQARTALIASYRCRALTLEQLTRRDEAMAAWAEALKLCDEVLALPNAKPGPDDVTRLTTMTDAAECLFHLEREAEALAMIDNCLNWAPGTDRIGNVDALATQVRFRHFEKAKDAAGCRATCEKWEKLKRTDEVSLLFAACMRAVTAAVVREDSKTPESEVTRLCKEEADRAIAWLKQAVAAGWNDAATIKLDKDFDALREREDFKRLITELERKSKK
jgi:serine/threonine-protein kinase